MGTHINPMDLLAILPFDEVAMLPQPGDNAAVAKSLLPSGTRIRLPHSMQQQLSNKHLTLSAPCLEGYRFAVHSIADGEEVLSWGLPFGTLVATSNRAMSS